MGVDGRLEAPIEQIDATGIVARGERIEAATVVWCAGVRATPVGRWLGVPTERDGTVRVEADLSVPGQDRIFVLGDAASATGPDGTPLPGLAAVAVQQGEACTMDRSGQTSDTMQCAGIGGDRDEARSEEHTSELQSLMRISYAVFCLKKKNKNK